MASSQALGGATRLKTGAASLLSTGDFVLRLVYFLVAPAMLLLIALILPIAGILINVGVAIVVYFLAQRIRRVPALSQVFGRALVFEAYYREHPPKPFLYYVFYPFLFPYWLSKANARRELFAYKSFTGMSLVILIGYAVYRYLVYWRPEIPIQSFLKFALLAIVIQLVVAMLFLMPLATSVIAYHGDGKKVRLAFLLGAMALSFGFTIHRHFARPPLIHPLEIAMRTRLRTTIAGRRAETVLETAAKAAAADLIVDQKMPDTLRDIWIEGSPADIARQKLAALYKPDECEDFKLSIVKTQPGPDALLLFQARNGSSPPNVWIAVYASGAKVPDDAVPKSELVNAQLGRRPVQAPKTSKRSSSSGS